MEPTPQYTHDQVEKFEIDTAITRNWTVNHRDIQVAVSCNNVTLSGVVYSLQERNNAEKIALQVAGVNAVNNQLLIITAD